MAHITHNGEWSWIRSSVFRLMTVPLAAAVGLGLHACSRTDQRPAGPAEKVTIAYATLPETALAQVAQRKGFFQQEGLDADANLHSFGKLALGEVLEGRADFATVAETPFVFAVMNGANISVIATIQNSTKNHAIIARRDRGIAAPKDLKGKKIGTTLGTTADFFMDSFLAINGISRKETAVVNLRPEEHERALLTGQVDALSTFFPYLRQTQSRLGNNGIIFYEKDIYRETFHVVAKKEFIRQNPEKVRRLLRGLARAEEFIRNNPAEAQEIVADFSKINIATLRDVWADNIFEMSLDQSLLLALEDESLWAIRNRLTNVQKVPNYLNFIYFDGLKAVKPQSARILR
jgi:ABC-type nitrate/sulfonate/bicarbonate transport system substrate-binding protein